jgi:long-subunit acyl-CoA synthetase (AMP-forming)
MAWHPITPTAGNELTPTLKTKRSVIEKKYAAAIDAMFAPGAKDAYIKFST